MMRLSSLLTAALLAAPTLLAAQGVDSTLLGGMRWRSVGPAHFEGRIADITGIPYPSRTLFVAPAAGGVWKSSSRGSLEKYDEEKVNGLKTALLQALKNASHIRSLTPEEWITVVIQGGLAMDGNILLKGAGGGKHVEVEVRRKEVRTNGGGAVTVVKRSGSPGETVMTLRVKKADVDALAGDKMTFDTFQKKAAIQAYIRRDAETDRPVRR